MNIDDDYLKHLIHVAQDLTRELAEVERRISEHNDHLEGEFLGPKMFNWDPAANAFAPSQKTQV